MSDNDPEKSATELGASIADVVTGFITGIAPFSAVKSAMSLIESIREENLLKKLERFLCQIKGITDAEIQEFYRTIDETPEDFARKLIIAVDRLDEIEKARVFGNLTKARMKGLLDSKDYPRLCSIVEKAYLEDLKLLVLLNKVNGREKYEALRGTDLSSIETALMGFGLMQQQITTDRQKPSKIVKSMVDPPEYKVRANFVPTNLGQQLVVYGIENPTYSN